ncbi:MAG: tRNA (adenosine(37)-N6)-threonylcarbamoyltransferase complex transferase subunit TsaD [Actinomycetota bacterium]|nr:tRNA (adenosine(37)-N6)-threonylcarbamoyltransferase complex transferase subunit TsaD [Actinomycetota bacterium]
MIVLGIETSCDETSVSLVEGGCNVISNVVASQIDLHRHYGGVVPEIASRAHLEAMIPVLREATSEFGGEKPDAIAVTVGPGLVGSLAVGVSFAKGLSWSWKLPMVGVNHVEAHTYAPMLEGKLPPFPFLALVVSGGHTLLALIPSVGRMEIVGETQDDALGEAFDKVSIYLGTGYPGGPVIDALSREGNPAKVRFPRPMKGSGNYNFSFSGLKTAVIRYVEKASSRDELPGNADIAASFQEAALEVVVEKTVHAAAELGIGHVVAAGGVACNKRLRDWLEERCGGEGIEVIFPSPQYCTDNAAMVAGLGFLLLEKGITTGLGVDVFPGLKPGEPVPS